VGEAKSLHPQQRLLRRDLQAAGEPGAGAGDGELQRAAAGDHPAPAHLLAEGGERQRLGDLRLGHIGAAAVTAIQVSVPDQLVEGGSKGQPGNSKVDAQLALGGDRLADRERLDEIENPVAGLLGLAHGLASRSWSWPLPPYMAAD